MNKMKKHIFHITLLLMGIMSLSACSDDDNGGDVSIDSVWSNWLNTDNTISDSRQITTCYPDKWIALKGHGFSGTTAVYCNGYACPVKEMNITDDWLIFQIKYQTPPSDSITDENVKSTIRVVTDHGEATLRDFIIKNNAAIPAVTSVSNTMPLAGQQITVRGRNLANASAVFFPGASGDIEGKIVSAQSDNVTVTVPDGTMQAGALRLVCLDENVYSPDYMYGSKGLLDISATDITLGSKAVLLQGQAAVSAATGLSATKYNLPALAVQIPPTAASMYLKETNYNINAHGRYFEISMADALEKARAASNIPQTTELKNLALQMDVYMPSAWTSGAIVTRFHSKASYSNTAENEYSAPWVINDDIKSSVTFDGFETVTIPLGNHSSLVNGNLTTIQAFIECLKGYKTDIGFSNCYINSAGVNLSSLLTDFTVFIGNIRLVNSETSDNDYVK